ncbi:MAG TPA: hypothetical protein VG939_10735 [Caulobacteraceae bacterium]|nr:hypothetical protein [Caulobacteraceae bacterium]
MRRWSGIWAAAAVVGALALALPAAASGGTSACPARARAPGDPRAMEALTPERLGRLLRYNQAHGQDGWIAEEVAARVLPEDQFESGPARSVTVRTSRGDAIAFEQPTDAVGAYLFAQRTSFGDLYVFRVDRDLGLVTALARTGRDRRLRELTGCAARRRLDLVLDAWAQVMDLAEG